MAHLSSPRWATHFKKRLVPLPAFFNSFFRYTSTDGFLRIKAYLNTGSDGRRQALGFLDLLGFQGYGSGFQGSGCSVLGLRTIGPGSLDLDFIAIA